MSRPGRPSIDWQQHSPQVHLLWLLLSPVEGADAYSVVCDKTHNPRAPPGMWMKCQNGWARAMGCRGG
jgi:hypothetical protein